MLAGLTLILLISGYFPRCCWNLEVVLQITTVSFLNPQSAASSRYPGERLPSEHTRTPTSGCHARPSWHPRIAGQQSMSNNDWLTSQSLRDEQLGITKAVPLQKVLSHGMRASSISDSLGLTLGICSLFLKQDAKCVPNKSHYATLKS